MDKRKVLVIVEGEKKDVKIAHRLFEVYSLDTEYEIITYKTNIYVLYQDMFVDCEPEDMDILQVLKQRETDQKNRIILEQRYTDILLLFDFEPHDPSFTDDKILEMQAYFSESSDMGKLYLNYPMIESFYHLKDIHDIDYMSRLCSISELNSHSYKMRVSDDTDNKMYNKLLRNSSIFKAIINHNLIKAFWVETREKKSISDIIKSRHNYKFDAILANQLYYISSQQNLYVFSTLCVFIYEYNSSLVVDI